ncbi:hypothetical protein BOSEA31B_11562 [Hyphomicrobiales bacterium]|nr:hypothetical protein BOSEA31B_11562 [Hyphomicrobiales bacterium]CAI0345544.1 hypothetical protein BO1005MUT1_30059 [Hyphomicrobiales bacterium]
MFKRQPSKDSLESRLANVGIPRGNGS